MEDICILIPMKNAEATLADCINSCLAQTITNFELLIIDDHSDDDSISLAKKLTSKLPEGRLRIVKNQGSGLVDALNTGLTVTSAEYIARMDSDDIMLPSRLEKQLAFMRRNPEIGVLSTQVELFPTSDITEGFAVFVDWQNTLLTNDDIRNAIYIETPMTHPSVMFRREVILNNGAYKNGDFPEDYELWLRLTTKGIKFAKLDEVLLRWRESPNRLSRTATNCRTEAFSALRSTYLRQDNRLSNAQSIVIWGAGRITRKRVALLTQANANINIERWIDVNPNKVGNALAGINIESPDWLVGHSPKPFVLIYVNNRGAREEIMTYLHSISYKTGADFLAVG